MEAGEAIAPPVVHSEDNPDCPFCPGEKKEYTTYEGEKNDSKALGNHMDDPDGFANSRETGARPKEPLSTEEKAELKKPEPIGVHPDPRIGAYSCEPHHLISGKQALAKNNQHHFEQWIKASHETISADTGYSVNNYDNGIWMPSVPENTKGNAGAWGKMDRQAVANEIMAQTSRQFHKGGYNIKETRVDQHGRRVPVPKEKRLHEQYDEFLINKLTVMNERMHGWADVCPYCFEGDIKKEKLQPSVRVNEALDRLSDIARREIVGSRERWTLFISALAWIYHEEVCTHGHSEPETESM